MPRTKVVSADASSQPNAAVESDLEGGAENRPNYSVPAVEKALDIIEYLSAEAVPMTRAQLARALNRQPAELFRMLTCLESRGYLWRDSGTNAYSLTLKLFELSRTHSPYEELLKVAIPHMRSLVGELRESCHRKRVRSPSGSRLKWARCIRCRVRLRAACCWHIWTKPPRGHCSSAITRITRAARRTNKRCTRGSNRFARAVMNGPRESGSKAALISVCWSARRVHRLEQRL
jgi:hypothetical protein